MEQILTKEKMEALKALSEINMQISNARNTLQEMKAVEAEYLQEREGKAIKLVDKVLKDSEKTLKTARNNYEKLEELKNTVTTFATFLEEAYEEFTKTKDMFEEKVGIWDQIVLKKEDEFQKIQSKIKFDTKNLEYWEKRLKEKEEKIKKDRQHLQSQQTTLAASYNELKSLWKKLNKN